MRCGSISLTIPRWRTVNSCNLAAFVVSVALSLSDNVQVRLACCSGSKSSSLVKRNPILMTFFLSSCPIESKGKCWSQTRLLFVLVKLAEPKGVNLFRGGEACLQATLQHRLEACISMTLGCLIVVQQSSVAPRKVSKLSQVRRILSSSSTFEGSPSRSCSCIDTR